MHGVAFLGIADGVAEQPLPRHAAVGAPQRLPRRQRTRNGHRMRALHLDRADAAGQQRFCRGGGGRPAGAVEGDHLPPVWRGHRGRSNPRRCRWIAARPPPVSRRRRWRHPGRCRPRAADIQRRQCRRRHGGGGHRTSWPEPGCGRGRGNRASLVHLEAAIHHQRQPRDHGRGRRGEEDDSAHQILGAQDPPERHRGVPARGGTSRRRGCQPSAACRRRRGRACSRGCRTGRARPPCPWWRLPPHAWWRCRRCGSPRRGGR